METIRDLKPFCISLVLVLIYIAIVVWRYGTIPAHAESLHFQPKTVHVSITPFTKHTGCLQHWIIKQDSPEFAEYKNGRLVEFEDMMCDLGVKKGSDLKLFAAQLLQENGALAENVVGDHGCSLGIPQYNACAHNHVSAKTFLKTHPEWLSYKYQLKWMSLAMMDKYNHFADSRRAIIAHNSPKAASKNHDTAAGYYATIVKHSKCLTTTL